METIQAVLTADRARRNRDSETSDDLFRFEDLDRSQEYTFPYPTLVSNSNVFSRKKLQNLKLEDVLSFVSKQCPMLSDLELGNGLVVAGSAAGSFIQLNRCINDIDIFFYDPAQNTEAAKKLLTRSLEALVNYYERTEINKDGSSRFYPNRVKIVRTQNTVTFSYYDRIKIQFILRLYKSVSDILHGFDLGSSAIAFNGSDLLFTRLGKYSYENSVNILDTTRRSTTYEHRLRKYFERGFDIVLPELDIKKLDTHLYTKYGIKNVLEMPYMVLTFKNVVGNKITVDSFYDLRGRTRETSDYDAFDENEYAAFFVNLSHLLESNYLKMVFISDSVSIIMEPPRSFSLPKIQFFYEELEEKIMTKFPVASIERYITVVSPSELISKRRDREYVSDVIKRQVAYVFSLVEKIDYNLKFMTENPGTQLTSSFNPIIEDASEWYGDYFLRSDSA